MPMIYYSASERGFFTDEIHGDNLPADVVEITDAEYRTLLDGQSEGQIIASNDSGRPLLAQRPEPTPDDLAAAARARRDALLNDLDTVVSNPLRWASFDADQQAALAAYRQALLDVPQQADFPDRIDWPDTPAFID